MYFVITPPLILEITKCRLDITDITTGNAGVIHSIRRRKRNKKRKEGWQSSRLPPWKGRHKWKEELLKLGGPLLCTSCSAKKQSKTGWGDKEWWKVDVLWSVVVRAGGPRKVTYEETQESRGGISQKGDECKGPGAEHNIITEWGNKRVERLDTVGWGRAWGPGEAAGQITYGPLRSR